MHNGCFFKQWCDRAQQSCGQNKRNARDLRGASQSVPKFRLSQYVPTSTNPTPNQPRAEGVSLRKTAEISVVKTGLKISRGVTKEASANFNPGLEIVMEE